MTINIEQAQKEFDAWYQPNTKTPNAEYFSHLQAWLAAWRVFSENAKPLDAKPQRPNAEWYQRKFEEIGDNEPAVIGGAAYAISSRHFMGQWYECHSIDEMQAFYMSRLPAIREAAKVRGYCIGVHGSMRRDFDLMAMQWTDEAVTPDELAHAIANAACGITREGPYQWEKKPQGRIATSFPVCWTDHSDAFPKDMLSLGHIDLSLSEPWLAHSTQEFSKILDSRPLHAIGDYEPQVEERYRYFWRAGWNAYRNALQRTIKKES